MDAGELRAWQRRCGLRTQQDAARVLRLSVSTYSRNVRGRLRIGEQTELLTVWWELFGRRVIGLEIVEAGYRLQALLALPIPQATAPKSLAVLEKIGALPDSRR
jgi:hypothetical protein